MKVGVMYMDNKLVCMILCHPILYSTLVEVLHWYRYKKSSQKDSNYHKDVKMVFWRDFLQAIKVFLHGRTIDPKRQKARHLKNPTFQP